MKLFFRTSASEFALIIFTMSLMVAFLAISCSDNSSSADFDDDPETIQDIEQNTYRVVRIGSQLWMSENLHTTRYKNGDEIPETRGEMDWVNLTTGSWVRYNHLVANDFDYGKLYNWQAVTDPRGICPDGWRVPSDDDWKTLEIYLGMSTQQAGHLFGRGGEENAGGKLKSLNLWMEPNTGATNESGFNGRPGGRRVPGGDFDQVTRTGYWWSSTEYNPPEAYARSLSHQNGEISRMMTLKRSGYSVRCMR